MTKRAPSIHLSLALLVGGALACTLVLVDASWPFYSVPQIWVRLQLTLRAILLACLLTALVGLGGLVHALVQKRAVS